MIEQQARQLQEQLQSIEQGVIELASLNLGLNELEGKKDKEIFAPLGRGIFVKAKLVSEKLNVDIGGKNFVEKSIPDTKKLIQEQIKKLEEIKKELMKELEKLNKDAEKIIEEAKKEAEKKKR